MSQNGPHRGEKRGEEPSSRDPRDRPIDPWETISSLLGGIILMGGLGWLVDRWAHTHFVVAIGMVIGAASSIYLVYVKSRHQE